MLRMQLNQRKQSSIKQRQPKRGTVCKSIIEDFDARQRQTAIKFPSNILHVGTAQTSLRRMLQISLGIRFSKAKVKNRRTIALIRVIDGFRYF